MDTQKLIAILLAIFIGGFGIQWFYVGETKYGIISLIFFWTGIPALIGLIVGIYWIFLPDSEFRSRYSKFLF